MIRGDDHVGSPYSQKHPGFLTRFAVASDLKGREGPKSAKSRDQFLKISDIKSISLSRFINEGFDFDGLRI